MSATTYAAIAQLLPASFNGALFYVKDDGAETGRRLHVAEFPGAEDPFIEDLGRRKRPIAIAGYVVGDDAAAAMDAIEAACELPGPGPLMMPAQGLVMARCERVKRRRDRDRAGLFSFDAQFIREGLSAPLIPSAFLAQGAFDAVSSFAAAAPAFLNAALAL